MNAYNPFFGPAAPDLGWIPAPRYLLRRERILGMIAGVQPGRLLEVGPGAGALLVEFTRAGFACEALEQSAAARQLATAFLAGFGAAVPVHQNPQAHWKEGFDLVCAFDVLEHIEEDAAALEQWHSWLRPGGVLLLSVPAHGSRWNAGDVWAGHYRRYEREGLVRLLAQNGFSVRVFECYGFPLANLTERIGAPMYQRKLNAKRRAKEHAHRQGSDVSGIDRSSHLHVHSLLTSWVGRGIFWGCMRLQRLFLRSDLGNGYLTLAVRK